MRNSVKDGCIFCQSSLSGRLLFPSKTEIEHLPRLKLSTCKVLTGLLLRFEWLPLSPHELFIHAQIFSEDVQKIKLHDYRRNVSAFEIAIYLRI